jgi:hypothetical protein
MRRMATSALEEWSSRLEGNFQALQNPAYRPAGKFNLMVN